MIGTIIILVTVCVVFLYAAYGGEGFNREIAKKLSLWGDNYIYQLREDKEIPSEEVIEIPKALNDKLSEWLMKLNTIKSEDNDCKKIGNTENCLKKFEVPPEIFLDYQLVIYLGDGASIWLINEKGQTAKIGDLEKNSLCLIYGGDLRSDQQPMTKEDDSFSIVKRDEVFFSLRNPNRNEKKGASPYLYVAKDGDKYKICFIATYVDRWLWNRECEYDPNEIGVDDDCINEIINKKA